MPLINLIRLASSQFDASAFDSGVTKAVCNTLVLAVFTTLSSLIVGTLCGFFISRTNLICKSQLKSFLLYPHIIPPFISALAWTELANPQVGFLTRFIPGINIYSMTGLVCVETLYWYTYILLNVANVLENMDGSLEESARVCGANPAKIFMTITLPLLRPTLIGSGLIVFLCSVSSFGVPAIIGIPGKIYVLTTMIMRFFKAAELGKAVTLSLPMMVFAAGLIFLSERWGGKKAFATMTGKHNRKLEINLRALRIPVTLVFIAFSTVAVLMPLLTLLITSLMSYYGNWSLSFANYAAVLQMAETRQSLVNSITLAFTGALTLSTLSFFIAYFKEKTSFRFRSTLTLIATIPYAMPGTIVAVAVYMFVILLNQAGLQITPFALLFVAYTAKYLSQSVRVISPAIANVDKSLEEASLMCGASWLRTLTAVWLPVLKGTLSTCLFLMVAPLFSELTMSILLTSQDFPTVGTRLFHLQEYENPNHASVLAVLVLVLIMGLNTTVKRLSRGRLGV